MSRMGVEIVAHGDGSAVIAKLLEIGGFELEIIHWPENNNTTIIATRYTKLDVDSFFDSIESIIAPFNADDPNNVSLLEAGIVIDACDVMPNLRAPGIVSEISAYL